MFWSCWPKKEKIVTERRDTAALHVLIDMKARVLLNAVDDTAKLHALADGRPDWLVSTLDGVSNEALAALADKRVIDQDALREISRLFDYLGVEDHVLSLMALMVPGQGYDPDLGNLRLPEAVKMKRCSKRALNELVEVGSIPWIAWCARRPSEDVCRFAARHARLDVLEWARAHGERWGPTTALEAAGNGHLRTLQWVRERGCDWNEDCCEHAAKNGHLTTLRWAREHGCPWNEWTCERAAGNNHRDCLDWAIAHGCPWNDTALHYLFTLGIRVPKFVAGTFFWMCAG